MKLNIPRIGVLIVTFNECEKTKKFVQNLIEKYGNEEYLELLIIDNNSTDNTYHEMKALFPGIPIIRLNDNYGCVTGRNIGIVELYNKGCSYVYISDNDIMFETDCFFLKLYQFLKDNPAIDGCCPIVKNGIDNTIQTLGSKIKYGIGKNVKRISSDTKIDILPGCAQFLPINTFKKYGLFDNDLSPISLEDYEWGFRNRNRANLHYLSAVSVLHFHDGHKHSKNKQKYSIVGRVVFLRKHYTSLQFIREIIFFINSARNYGSLFTLKYYFVGMVKKMEKNNFNFNAFASTGINKYLIV